MALSDTVVLETAKFVGLRLFLKEFFVLQSTICVGHCAMVLKHITVLNNIKYDHENIYNFSQVCTRKLL